jgi:hypothetical protein
VESDCSATICGVRVSSSFDQRLDRERPERGRCEMECCVPDVQLVRDFLDEMVPGDARTRDLGRLSNESHCRGFVGDDGCEEPGKGRRSVRHDC